MNWIRALLLIAMASSVTAAQVGGFQNVDFDSPLSFAQRNEGNASNAARTLFNQGRDFWDDGRYADAESKFREVLVRYPRSDYADRSSYYLITTLAKLGKAREALNEISRFQRNYPRSPWMTDVLEKRISLTNEVPANLTVALAPRQNPANAPITPSTPSTPNTPNAPVIVTPSASTRVVEVPPQPAAPGGQENQGPWFHYTVDPTVWFEPVQAGTFHAPVPLDPETSLQQEILRVLLRNDPARGIAVARARLQNDPADPVVISNLHGLANSMSDEALPLLAEIARTSQSPRAKREAVFWIGRSRGDRDVLVRTLEEVLANTRDKDIEAAVAGAFADINTPRSRTALLQFVRDTSRSIEARRGALSRIARDTNTNQLPLLEELYGDGSTSLDFRRAVVSAIARTPDARAIAVLARIAATDTDVTVRRTAVQALGTRKDAEALRALEELLTNVRPSGR